MLERCNIKVDDLVEYVPNKDKPNTYPYGFPEGSVARVSAYFWEGVVGLDKKLVVERRGMTLTLPSKNLRVIV